MATAQALPRAATAGGEEIKFEYGVPQVFALKFLSAKEVQGKYGARALFTASDDRRIWLDTEDASDIERTIRALGVQPGDPIRVMKVRHPKGGGHSMRVERFSDAAEPAMDVEAQLRASIELAREKKARLNGQAGGQTQPVPSQPSSLTGRNTNAPASLPNADAPTHHDSAPPAPLSSKGSMGNLLAGALIAAIDAHVLAVAYAKSKGLTVSLALDFNGEDVRAAANCLMIQYFKDGGTR